MPYSNEDPLPEWFRKSGARRANKDSDKDGKIWQPDFSDPLYLKYWSELVAEAGRRYDGNPFLESVDISFCRLLGRRLESVHAGVSISEDAHRRLVGCIQTHAAADELR